MAKYVILFQIEIGFYRGEILADTYSWGFVRNLESRMKDQGRIAAVEGKFRSRLGDRFRRPVDNVG